jgi:ribonuclease D
MEIFFSLSRSVPANVWDTQVAAALAGRGESISYARLIEDLCGVRLRKVETFTDWSKRPLSKAQLEYALDDVRYLLEARRKLLAELEGLGRLEWLGDELRFYGERRSYEKDRATLYLRIRSAARLDAQELAVLRELAAWREEEAERQDWPRGHVLLDEALVELARRAPAKVEDIGRVRGIHPQLIRRAGAEIVRRVELARQLPPAEWPAPIERRGADDELSLVVDALEVVLRARAAANRIAPGYVASRKDLEELARRSLRPGDGRAAADRDLPILTGWRRELAGAALLDLLAGKSRIAIDAGRARVEVADR